MPDLDKYGLKHWILFVKQLQTDRGLLQTDRGLLYFYNVYTLRYLLLFNYKLCKKINILGQLQTCHCDEVTAHQSIHRTVTLLFLAGSNCE